MRQYVNGCYFSILSILLSIFCLVSSLLDLNHLIPYKENLEYCVAEEFKSECPENHIVIITVALYGMMKMERCLTIDYGFIGCKSDAIEHLDNLCSGRRNCQVRVPDLTMESYIGCPPSFKSYLNISYSCLPVEIRACDICRYNNDNFALVTHQSASLASTVTEETNQCGSAKCPWRIEVQSGQTINITLFDFGMDSTRKIIGDNSDSLMCKRYAVIKEKAHMRDTAICGKTARFQHIYQSVSNIVEIHIVSPAVFLSIGQFVINYEAIGCPDIEPQTNGKVRRIGDKSEIVCSDGQRWEVQCIKNDWKGDLGSCSEPESSAVTIGSVGPLSVGLLAAIVIGIALVIAVLIVTIGVVCLKRQHGDRQDTLYVRADQLYELHEPYQGEMTGSLGSMAARKKVKILPGDTVRIAGHPAGRRNFYDVPKNMETRPLPSIPNIEGQRQNNSRQQVAVEASMEEPPQISNENLPPPEPSQFSSFRPSKPPQLYTVLDPAEVQQQQTVPPAWGDDPTLAGYFYASSSEGAASNDASEMPTLLSRQPSQAQQAPNNSSWP